MLVCTFIWWVFDFFNHFIFRIEQVTCDFFRNFSWILQRHFNQNELWFNYKNSFFSKKYLFLCEKWIFKISLFWFTDWLHTKSFKTHLFMFLLLKIYVILYISISWKILQNICKNYLLFKTCQYFWYPKSYALPLSEWEIKNSMQSWICTGFGSNFNMQLILLYFFFKDIHRICDSTQRNGMKT